MEHDTNKAISALDKITENVGLKSDEEINRLISETEQTLHALIGELKKRHADMQHKDIDNLEEHLDEANTSFKALRKFIAMALKEIRGQE